VGFLADKSGGGGGVVIPMAYNTRHIQHFKSASTAHN
jgi:hypothetical protein